MTPRGVDSHCGHAAKLVDHGRYGLKWVAMWQGGCAQGTVVETSVLFNCCPEWCQVEAGGVVARGAVKVARHNNNSLFVSRSYKVRAMNSSIRDSMGPPTDALNEALALFFQQPAEPGRPTGHGERQRRTRRAGVIIVVAHGLVNAFAHATLES